MFIALVSFSNDTSIQNLENSMNNNQLIQQILVNNSLNTTQFVIWLQNGIWAIIVYFIICLLISFLALISMNIRILSGILFLIASIITLPLVLLFITLIIPIFFFITAIMMFARRSKLETVPAYGSTYDYPPYYNQRDDYDDRYYYEEEPTQYNDEEEYIEPPRKTKNQNVVLVVNLQVIIMKENMIMRIIIILIKIIMSKILMMILRKINIINILNVL